MQAAGHDSQPIELELVPNLLLRELSILVFPSLQQHLLQGQPIALNLLLLGFQVDAGSMRFGGGFGHANLLLGAAGRLVKHKLNVIIILQWKIIGQVAPRRRGVA